MQRKYTYIFADSGHGKIKDLRQLKKLGWDAGKLGLFCNGVQVGTALLEVESLKKRYVHTDAVYLHDKFRRKGHGIFLYCALILAAKKLNAKRIYSSKSLNKFSRRMWRDKLKRLGLQVNTIGTCKNSCKHCNKSGRYYINL